MNALERVLPIAAGAWGIAVFSFWLYAAFTIAMSFRASSRLLKRVREESPETFQFLHEGSINSASGVVPYLTVNAVRFGEFLGNEKLNEVPDIKGLKGQYQRTSKRMWPMLKVWIMLLVLPPVAFGIIAVTANALGVH